MSRRRLRSFTLFAALTGLLATGCQRQQVENISSIGGDWVTAGAPRSQLILEPLVRPQAPSGALPLYRVAEARQPGGRSRAALQPSLPPLAAAVALPGGKALVYLAADGALVIWRPDRSEVIDREVTLPFSVREDGLALAYSRLPPVGGGIQLLDLLRGERRTVHAGEAASTPIFSPCGAWVAFVGTSSEGLASIFAAPAAGGPALQLTNVGLRRRPPGLPPGFVPPPDTPESFHWDLRGIHYVGGGQPHTLRLPPEAAAKGTQPAWPPLVLDPPTAAGTAGTAVVLGSAGGVAGLGRDGAPLSLVGGGRRR